MEDDFEGEIIKHEDTPSQHKIGEASSSCGSMNPENIDSTPLKWRSLSEIY